MEIMKILHYFLGFPPYRSGGLTKYALDLMKAQVSSGDEVSALWPGKIGIIRHKICFVEHKSFGGIRDIELINPLPVPLDEGICNIDSFTKSCDISVYQAFLEKENPDVIHLHTLMGIHREFIDAANLLHIRTVYTTHDYFGLCPKVTFFKGQDICNSTTCEDCSECNASALSVKKIIALQSPLYRKIKNFWVIEKLRKQHRKKFFDADHPKDTSVALTKDEFEYQKLRDYYIGILENINMIHYNSSISKKVFEKFICAKNSKTISITHENVMDNREKLSWHSSSRLRITYLAPAKPYKGYNVLYQALSELWNEMFTNFQLTVYTPVPHQESWMSIHDNGYTYKELPTIFEKTDILIAPSIWYETFGFTVLEALSYGVPVIVSDRVGAKDIVRSGGLIIEAGSVEALKNAIKSLNEDSINIYRANVKNTVLIKTWKEFVQENYELYS